ncbi:hypothetical protein L3X38_015548 [Prunus dulcis]|uniref:NB-ARC domain-containing disease resistance protein n=1 Tax=Prunus dulcis TaxID=3755 RepID=A0AAD4W4A3_PRUDU|nr:hypothetical protein L3X38_015548 [Prunus dulcis]
MAEIFLTFAAEEILKKVASLAAQEFNLAWGFKAELTRLSESLNMIHDILSDAVEQPQGRGKAVEEWVKKLKHIAYDADDVLDEFKYEDLRSKVGLRNQIHIKIINASLVNLENRAFVIGLVAKNVMATTQYVPRGIVGDRETNSFLDKDENIVGRKEVVSSIITTLINSKNVENVSIMAIVGMPGLGKATLANSVYNEFETNRHFDKKICL